MGQPIRLSTSHHQPLPISWVEGLFKRMSLSYGSRFADMWAGVNLADLKAHWAQQLGALSDSELVTGYRMLDTRDWPPTLPEFIKLCRPNLDPEVAFHEALEQGSRRERGEQDVWSHAAIYWAYVRVGAFAMMHQGYEVLRPRWTDALRMYAEDPELQPVPVKRKELPAPGKTRLQPERAKKLLAELKVKGLPQRFGLSVQTDWAKAILDRHERGEPVTAVTLDMAEQALGLRA